MNKKIKIIILTWIGLMSWTAMSCDKSKDPLLPRITHLELGSGDNGIGTVGGDLHLEIDIEAGDRIDLVTIRIVQRTGETYTHGWNYEIVWDEYRGSRNAHIHEHFDIPEDAAPGMYDFVVAVSDQNGTSTEVRRDFTIRPAGA